jgi:hypothetical protein
MFAADRHGSLQNAAAVLTYLAGVISGQQVKRRKRAGRSEISLDIKDAYPASGQVEAFASNIGDDADLIGRLENLETGSTEAIVLERDGGRQVFRQTASPGAYRLTIAAPTRPT